MEDEATDVHWITAHKLARAQMLALFRTGDLLSAGLELWATGQAPHYDVVHQDVVVLVNRLLHCPHQVVENLNFTGPAGGR